MPSSYPRSVDSYCVSRHERYPRISKFGSRPFAGRFRSNFRWGPISATPPMLTSMTHPLVFNQFSP
ncbi:hypothetical protein HBI56_011590 [Parastagonospora nodorum]|uniref:Uncharacterized protein n=1 Tax=Phaeosphaeria nodorum (strain SN15 / ATCC MYA-4574 / FGSC 10173) TaxID=321614 RepID=A0A7U2HW04_PHANO|nr:hypothetical protein HBH56_010160 [Parastagonospora nodorum]QRC90706.1 hypothetical protein JI435_002260 [Parastagonospora nodorum SN15]KAH3934956.1 hypothetical protein HBH54_043460 [Parastagonospora nodorum]KAH3943734.1 hypothetical protein HBH53_170410 [Parastagonospora nodorum]KAH3987175.1 hypothetical protein HBH51_013320 [Parastagonospora nodorum]